MSADSRDTHAVYYCYDAEGRLLYIGCTQNLTARMQVHGCDADNRASVELMKRLDLVEYAEYPDRETALAVERAEIQRLSPLLNTHHNLGRGMRDLPPAERPRLTDEQREAAAAALARFSEPERFGDAA